MALVECSAVNKSYEGPAESLIILEDVHLDLQEGEILAITGESGSGKSTLLNLVSGLDKASGGSIRACGFPITQLSESQLGKFRSQHLGMVFQFHFLLKEFTALENVYLPAWIAGEKPRSAQDRARDLLERVGLGERIHHHPSQLSGGERQRVALARALINKPPLLLADEPTGNLDVQNSRVVEDLMFNLVRQEGSALILVTHDRELAGRADTHYHLSDRRLVRL